MQSDISIQKGKGFLKDKDYKSAIREFKKAIRVEKTSPGAHFYLSRAYLKYGLKEKEPTFYRLADDAVRYAIRIDPYELKYHDSLIEISAKLGKLDELSTEYNKKMEKAKNNDFYKELLRKISTISILSIPEAQETKKGNKKGKVFLNYIVMPVIVSALVSVFLIPKLNMLRFPAVIILAGFILFKIFSRPKSKAGKDQW
ncbi:MAG: hypothetical protein PF545_07350 [Elusimicrobia bacterium]|jgi:tetratricopeptide (TPR) repeat protein|nr:hypothetical protein [Elusimicrobiota bacterium]